MNLFKRALLFIMRKRNKTIILLLLLVVIATLAISCLSIGRASILATAKLRESIGGYFKIEPNYESGTIGRVDDALIEKVVSAGGIKASNGVNIRYLMTDDLALAPGRFAGGGDQKAQVARFISSTDSSLHEYFSLRSFTLTEGRHIAPSDNLTAVISSTLAADNGLAIGDVFDASYYFEV